MGLFVNGLCVSFWVVRLGWSLLFTFDLVG